MIINVRCVTCGHVIADKWEYYKREVAKLEKEAAANRGAANGGAANGGAASGGAANNNNNMFGSIQTKKILDDLDLHKYCCRRMFLGHVDLIDEI
jgi:DNA-directed RNA polymerase subunit N (RpoN/RPB10)